MLSEFSLPWPPPLSSYFGVFRNRKILSRKGRAYKKLIVSIDYDWPVYGNNKVEAWLCFYPPSRRSYDTDNYLKALFDAMELLKIIDNDSQFYLYHIMKTDEVTKGGRIDVRITELKEKIDALSK